jgi:hypothetical protein
MPPQAPDATYAPTVQVDDSKKYAWKCVGIDEQASKFRDRRKDAMTLVHRGLLYDMETGEALTDLVTGDLYEQWFFTPDTTYDNPTTGKIAPAREVANALCGKRLTDDEVKGMIRDGWEKSLVGKIATVDLEWFTRPDGQERLRILRFKPYRGRGATGESLPEPEPAPAAVVSAPPTPIAVGNPRRLLD